MQAVVDVEKPVGTVATTEDCRYCWMCRHVCPVGHVTQRETLTPHGWALTIASVRRGTLHWSDETVDTLYACADCGLCRAHCITDRPLPDAIAATRAEVVAAGLAPAVVYELKEKLERGAAADPHRALARGVDGDARVRGDVALFVGESARDFGGREIDAARRLLAAIGVAPVLIGDGRSSGLLASSLGLRDTAAMLARATLDEIESAGCRELLVLTPGDRFAFERVYRDRLQIAWPPQVAIKEVTALLADALAAGRLAFRPRANAAAATYAYHDPCHVARIDRDDAAPRKLLKAAIGELQARELFWRERRAHPCGATGGLQFTQPAIAAKLADARLADARAAGASWLITDDPACAQHLRSRPQQDVAVLGFYELLADQLASQSSQPG